MRADAYEHRSRAADGVLKGGIHLYGYERHGGGSGAAISRTAFMLT